MTVTSRVNPTTLAVKPKPFTWTYTKLKNYEACPKRHLHVDILKDYEEEESEELRRGNALHNAMYRRIGSGIALPREFAPYMEPWAQTLTKEFHHAQIIQCEQKLAITKELKGSAYMDKVTWFRCKIDYIKLLPTKVNGWFYAHIVDYKTGRPKEDDTQLALNAAAVFANYPDVYEIRSDFLWTEYNDVAHYGYKRDDMKAVWEDLTPRVNQMEKAYIEASYPARKCGLCKKYCPVYDCENFGK